MYEGRLDFRDEYGYDREFPSEQLPADLAEAFGRACNSGLLKIRDAKTFVGKLAQDHRTLQALVMNFFLAVVHEYGQQVGETSRTDPRNQTIAETCKKIKALKDQGELPFNPFI